MTWQGNIQRWRALPEPLKRYLRLSSIPKNVAESMAFEGEPVPIEKIRVMFEQSTYVTLRIVVGGAEFPVAKMASDFIILRDSTLELPPRRGEMIMEVNGKPSRFVVHLPEGVCSTKQRTPISIPARRYDADFAQAASLARSSAL